jgi:hypothetical protein
VGCASQKMVLARKMDMIPGLIEFHVSSIVHIYILFLRTAAEGEEGNDAQNPPVPVAVS